jgi:hypothetical protein
LLQAEVPPALKALTRNLYCGTFLPKKRNQSPVEFAGSLTDHARTQSPDWFRNHASRVNPSSLVELSLHVTAM